MARIGRGANGFEMRRHHQVRVTPNWHRRHRAEAHARNPPPAASVIAAGKHINARMKMPMRNALSAVLLPAIFFAGPQTPKSQARTYPPIGEYLMPQAAEVALAKSAAPANISDRATIKVLTTAAFKVVH